MASIPTQEEVLAATRKSQEAMIAAIKNWLETVRAATPKVASVYAPLTGRLPKLPSVSLPFADRMPTPQDAVASAYNMAEQLLASQRKFTEELLKAMTPLMPGQSESSPEGSGEPEVPSRRAWHEAVAETGSEPKAVPASTGPKAAPARPAGKSTAGRSTPGKSTPGKSTAGKSTAGKSTAKRTAGRPAPKGTDA
jgi:hypothetical protein